MKTFWYISDFRIKIVKLADHILHELNIATPRSVKENKTILRRLILKIIDPFYPVFRKFLTLQTYRYGVCGGANTGFDILLYFVFYNFVLQKQNLEFAGLVLTPHIAAFFLAFFISFPTGFILMRLVVFPQSVLRKRIQLIRYFLVVVLNTVMNYALLKLFVEVMHIYPTVSKILNTVIIVTVTYLLQRKFTFKEKPEIIEGERDKKEVDLLEDVY